MTFQSLYDVLQHTEYLYGRLVELSELKKEQLVNNRINELTESLTHESKIVKGLQEAEVSRIAAVRAVQRSLGLRDDPGMKLQAIVKYCTGSAEKQALSVLLDQISQQILKLKRLNETNQMLVRHSLDIVNFSLDLLVGGPEDEPIYKKPSAAVPATKRNSYLDTRA